MEITIKIRRPGWSTPARLRRLRPLLLVVALVFAGPVLASDRFSDVPESNVHHANINAIADAGITLGCNAGGTLYCPDTAVTRDQMGSFLARAAGLGANPPVANADLLDGIDASGFLPAGDYVVMQQGPWHASRNSAVTIRYFENANYVDSALSAGGERWVQLALDGPAAVVGGIGYGFATARICPYGFSNAYIDTTWVAQGNENGTHTQVTDVTNQSGGCYTVTDDTPTIPVGGTTLLLDLQYTGAGYAGLTSVTTTWTPVSP